MKKVLGIVLMLVLSMALFACGETPNASASASAGASASASPSSQANVGVDFDGEFTTEANSEEAVQMFSDLETQNADIFNDQNNEVGDMGWNGYKFSMVTAITSGSVTTSVTASGKMIFKQDGSFDKGEFLGNVGGMFNAVYNMYIADNCLYMNYGSYKLKYRTDDEEAWQSFSSIKGDEILNSLKNLLAEKETLTESGVKIYIDEDAAETRIKFDMTEVSGIAAAGYSSYYMVVVLDESDNVIGMQLVIELDGQNNKQKMTYEIAPYSGTITLPDLTGYTDMTNAGDE